MPGKFYFELSSSSADRVKLLSVKVRSGTEHLMDGVKEFHDGHNGLHLGLLFGERLLIEGFDIWLVATRAGKKSAALRLRLPILEIRAEAWIDRPDWRIRGSSPA